MPLPCNFLHRDSSDVSPTLVGKDSRSWRATFRFRPLHLICYLGALFAATCHVSIPAVAAGDSHGWPTARYNPQRNAFSPAALDPARLEPAWEYRTANPPSPAWHGPAKWDAYSDVRMHSMRNYDEVPQLIGAASRIYFGSSVDDTVTCLDAATGEEVWSYFTEGPVRIAPTHHEGKIYFGSDDGCAYCVDAADGTQLWKFRPTTPERLVINNGRFVSPAPIRSGVAVSEGTAYFAASLLPWSKSYLCAVDATTGKATAAHHYVQPLDNMTFEGPLAVSPRLVIAPQGRVPPLLFSRRTGKHLGGLDGGGGSFVVVLPNQKIVHGPGNKTGWFTVSDDSSREKLATHNSARALVLDNDRTYLLTRTSIGAIATEDQRRIWRTPCTDGIELIGVGHVLLVGKPDLVEAYSARNGDLLWRAPVVGKPYGMSFADDRLLVSTDLGVIHAFAETRSSEPAEDLRSTPAPSRDDAIDQADLAPIQVDGESGLWGHWAFQPPHLEAFEAACLGEEGPAAVIDGDLRPVRVGRCGALDLTDGDTSITIAEDVSKVKLPKARFSAAAWVRVDKTQPWGGIFSALQDNGDDEKGWLLGYRGDRFCFGLASRNGGGRLTYLSASEPFTPGAWHHVAATYDGKTMRLLVDGKLAAKSDAQSGQVEYAAAGPVVIGAYRDKDENFPLRGMIHEVRVYNRLLTTQEIQQQHRDKAPQFPPPAEAPAEPETFLVEAGPWLQFTQPGAAVIRWQTAEPSPTILEYGQDDETKRIFRDERVRVHEVELTELRRKRLYHYAIEFQRADQRLRTPQYECDTFFDYNVQTPRDDDPASDEIDSRDRSYQAAATSILKRSQCRKGLCLDWNADTCHLAEQLVRQSELRVLCVCRDRAAADAAQRRLRARGLYGSRIVIRHAQELRQLQLTPHWANLVVSEATLLNGQPPASVAALRRVLAPTGTAVLGVVADAEDEKAAESLQKWNEQQPAADELATAMSIEEDAAGLWATVPGVPFDGAGEWPYIYGRADNSAFGGETLAGARSSADLAIQWLGRPGPRYQADRSGRKTPPVAFGGRLFLEGLHRIVALDIYNGSIQWALETPHFQRFNIPRDCANWCGASESLYAAVRDRCWRINAATGKVVQMYEVPEKDPLGQRLDWGFVAIAPDRSRRDLVIGSAVKQGTSYEDYWGKPGWYDAADGPETFKVCSDSLFACGVHSGDVRWTHSQGLVVNSTITMASGRLFFVEGRDPELKSADARRLNSSDFWRDQFLVALDAATGELLWETPLDTVDGTAVFFMAHGNDKLVIVASAAGKFHAYALADDSGKLLWDVEFPWGAEGKADHGSHLSRPAIVGNRLFVRPAVIDLQSGEILDQRIPEGKCGTYACTQHALFYRGNPGARFAMWSADDNQYSLWDRLRPDCWLSSIPAGGMLLSPEGGGGCSCGSWMETSIGFIPKIHLEK